MSARGRLRRLETSSGLAVAESRAAALAAQEAAKTLERIWSIPAATWLAFSKAELETIEALVRNGAPVVARSVENRRHENHE